MLRKIAAGTLFFLGGGIVYAGVGTTGKLREWGAPFGEALASAGAQDPYVYAPLFAVGVLAFLLGGVTAKTARSPR